MKRVATGIAVLVVLAAFVLSPFLSMDPPSNGAPPSIAPEEDCATAKNTCPDYSVYWHDACPQGARCLTVKNSCTYPVGLAYQVGCDGNGKPGAPQCSCSPVPGAGGVLPVGMSAYWKIVDGEYTPCLPSWKPACLTAGLAIIANANTASCTSGTRVEFTAGNGDNDYNHFDSYNLAVGPPVGQFYSIPVSFKPDIACAVDHANHDCRPLWCDSDVCPDAYATPTTGGCPDGRSPQASCQDTFGLGRGYTIEFCPASGKSCQDAKACP